jgi:FkbM family methyltransferase
MPLGIELARDLARALDIDSFRVIFDVGANVGQMSEFFCEQFPAATIQAFEPISATSDQLRGLVGGTGRIHCHRFVMGKQEGPVKAFCQAESGLNSLNAAVNLADSRMAERAEMVSVTTVDDFCRENQNARIDLLKTDAEGMDLAVLKGAERMIRIGRNRCILSECALNPDNVRNTPFRDLAAFLSERNYRLKAFFDQSDFEGSPYMTYANALFMLHDPRSHYA